MFRKSIVALLLVILSLSFIYCALALDASSFNTENQQRVAKDSLGNLHLVYASQGEIFYQESSDDGESWDDPVNISQTEGKSDYPAIAVDSEDNLYVVWDEFTPNGNYIILFKKFSVDKGWDDKPANVSTALAWAWYPSISVDSKGNVRVTWLEVLPRQMRVLYKKYISGKGWESVAKVLGVIL